MSKQKYMDLELHGSLGTCHHRKLRNLLLWNRKFVHSRVQFLPTHSTCKQLGNSCFLIWKIDQCTSQNLQHLAGQLGYTCKTLRLTDNITITTGFTQNGEIKFKDFSVHDFFTTNYNFPWLGNAENPAFWRHIFAQWQGEFFQFSNSTISLDQKFHDLGYFSENPWLFQAWKINFQIPWLFMTFCDCMNPVTMQYKSCITWDNTNSTTFAYNGNHRVL